MNDSKQQSHAESCEPIRALLDEDGIRDVLSRITYAVNYVLDPFTIAGATKRYVDAIHDSGTEIVAVQVTRDEIEVIVTRYLESIRGIDAFAEAVESMGSSELGLRRYSWDRIQRFIISGAIEKSYVDEFNVEITKKVFPPDDQGDETAG
jgi:hypothetical protein